MIRYINNKTKNSVKIVYKILEKNEWENFFKDKKFSGTSLDLKDGYIHMSSTQAQMERIKEKYYKDKKALLLHINLDKLMETNKLKYEPISNGDLYPHLYDDLLIDQVEKVIEM